MGIFKESAVSFPLTGKKLWPTVAIDTINVLHPMKYRWAKKICLEVHGCELKQAIFKLRSLII